ncbi:GFA family protein [uncultured Sphingomonas sp.]|uniref:GFA family protein n=1 Tax=uncultured Sphingomonas sp. TaxID=158754 RepID=UPI0025FABD11|nr:GFA family protein [uncultured Sphingomonas sp.]
MTAERTASCRCGQLRATVTGDPVRVSVCHCLDCQKRSSSVFAAQVRFPAEAVTTDGKASAYAHSGGGGNVARFHFCPSCGDTLFFTNDNAPETIAIPMGAFDDPYFVRPNYSVWEQRKHPWVEISDAIEHFD